MKRVAAVLAAGMLLSIPVPAQVDQRGIVAAWVAANQRIDVRLVKETKGTDLVEKIRAHVKAQGYFIVDGEPDAQVRAAHDRMASLSVAETITGAFRTPVTNPEARGVVESLQKAFDAPPVQLRTLGGTVPIAQFIDALGFPAILAPTVNFDNNQHEDNENLRLGHLFQAIEIIAAILRS
jgi:acetylornithine deacetylase/succinyl-diaminopimelate desuccinylase-like protein